MKTLENLTTKDSIAFEDVTDGLTVSKVQEIYDDGRVYVCYLYSGYKSTSDTLNPEEILAIGDPKGNTILPGWKGKYTVLQKEKLEKLIRDNN